MKDVFPKAITAFIMSFMLVAFSPAAGQTQLAATGGAARQAPASLKAGDDAPPIVAAKWFKGEPVTTFTPGHVYVIEFWATWCGPCRAAMPHLSELAKQYKGKATVIGLDVMELVAYKDKNGDYITKVANFVKNLGNGMDYTVAADTREGIMSDTWMKAAGQGGIPCSFVIDQQGKIAWIGHPMNLDDVLPLVVEGRFNEEAKKQLTAIHAERTRHTKALRLELDSLRKAGNTDKAIAVVSELIDQSKLRKASFIITKYELLRSKGGVAAAAFAGEVAKQYNNDPLTLQSFADSLSKMERPQEKALAVRIMEQAVARSAPDDPYAYSNLAAVYFRNGDIRKAVASQEKVVAILDDTSLVEQGQSVKDKARKELEKYKAAM